MRLSRSFSDLQAHVLIGFSDPYQSLVFFRIEDAAAFKAKAPELLERLTWASRVAGMRVALLDAGAAGETLVAEPKPGKVGLAFAYRGLAKLALAAELDWLKKPRYYLSGGLEEYGELNTSSAFSQDCEKRANTLLMDSWSTIATWLVGSGDKLADGVLIFAGATAPGELAWRDATLQLLGASISVVHVDVGEKLASNREHFGFVDAVSLPFADLSNADDGDRALADIVHGTQRYDARQLLLLPAAVDPESTEPPGMPAWVENGSFLVYRRLDQRVGEFHQGLAALAAQAAALGLAPAQATAQVLGERVFGRTLGGHSLVAGAVDPDGFNYDNDAGGQQCPFSAHVRRGNPRRSTNPRPLFRRSIPFGPPSTSTFAVPRVDNASRGLLFLGYQASIERQFEYISANWLNSPGDRVIDALVGRRTGETELRSVELGLGTMQLRSYVSASGGGYFLALSRSGLAALLA